MEVALAAGAEKLYMEDIDKMFQNYDAGMDVEILEELQTQWEEASKQYKSKGEGLTIKYGFHPSPFGECLLATTERGICGFFFVKNRDRKDPLSELRYFWKKADIVEDPHASRELVERIFNPSFADTSAPLHLILNGTNFQIKVWAHIAKAGLGAFA